MSAVDDARPLARTIAGRYAPDLPVEDLERVVDDALRRAARTLAAQGADDAELIVLAVPAIRAGVKQCLRDRRTPVTHGHHA